ncbi:MAG: hypothetical protein AYL30_003140 [Candidatus Hecatellales archaeon B24]|nr:MAG: hypothetical protein AYL30_003140 [Candidatus Hecatellales archaeon B24]
MAGKIFTFLSEKLAKNGYVFIYEGEVAPCVECDFYKVCHGKLKPNMAYRVVEVKDKKIKCPVLGPSCLVRVEQAEIEAAVEAGQALEGALIRFNPQECGLLTCQYFNLCVPVGLEEGDKSCKIVNVSEAFTCPQKGVRLARVSLQLQKA